MTGKENAPSQTALRKLEASLDLHEHARAAKEAMQRRRRGHGFFRMRRLDFRRPLWRWLALGSVGSLLGLGLACTALWWRLASGPISLDIATPWLTSAIEENFGNRHHVQVGGTQLERDESGRPRLRIIDIVVRDADGTVVA